MDAIEVLRGAGLHPAAVAHLKEARRLARKAAGSFFFKDRFARAAIDALLKARAELIE